MQIEKFSSQDKQGYKIVGATFASSRNRNSRYFDPIEVFADRQPPEKFNLGHEDYETDYSTGTVITKEPEAKIEGKLLKFTWDIETTNENFVKLIESEKFNGFSPELRPKKQPLKGKQIGVTKKGKPIFEHFYRQGELEWFNTAILIKGQTPGFIGADEYEIEKFESIEDSDFVIFKAEENDEISEITSETPTATPEVTEEPKTENFDLKSDLEMQLMYVKSELEEYKSKMIDLEKALSALQSSNSSENFAALEDENTALKAQIKALEIQKQNENNNANSKLPENIESFSKAGPVGLGQNNKDLNKTKKSLIDKIF